MAFTLDKTQGKGSATVKVTADVNKLGNQVTGQILVQVNGITKQVVQLVQKAAANYKVFVQAEKTNVSADGEDIKITYWVTLNGEVDDSKYISISGTHNIINSGTDGDGKKWIVDRINANSLETSVNMTYNVSCEYEPGKTATASTVVIQSGKVETPTPTPTPTPTSPTFTPDTHIAVYGSFTLEQDGGSNFSIPCVVIWASEYVGSSMKILISGTIGAYGDPQIAGYNKSGNKIEWYEPTYSSTSSRNSKFKTFAESVKNRVATLGYNVVLASEDTGLGALEGYAVSTSDITEEIGGS